ncbi:class I glutamine amidotransferase-like protein [Myriangium duriaei CBS 260.36]|uniref:Class I glutamine amidotransferase-like protein n=1 Tax=Myriangium duriaei CBS 260.36 TaxID=1168546 RepID=A0A9P4JE33_9PEZI|nr:class I glutamine amidotransferase-like protein [Myriangium duriaei CBS 260.36]
MRISKCEGPHISRIGFRVLGSPHPAGHFPAWYQSGRCHKSSFPEPGALTPAKHGCPSWCHSLPRSAYDARGFRYPPTHLPLLPSTFLFHHQQQPSKFNQTLNTVKMSAIAEENGDQLPEIKVLFCLYDNFDTMDVTGPLEVLGLSTHENNQRKAFKPIFAAPSEHTVSRQGASFRAHVDYKEALKLLPDIDVVVVPGGDYDTVIKEKGEPLNIIKAYGDLQKKNPARERTIFSVCTGAFLLAHQGILAGQCATTHPDAYTKFENLLKSVAQRDMSERTDLMEERYVVNNPRFDLGDEDENPYIRRRSDARRPSNARKGSNSWKESNTRRESNARRQSLALGGLRIITSGGITTGLDASLYLVSAMVSLDSANEVARVMQYEWHKGVVVKGVDV